MLHNHQPPYLHYNQCFFTYLSYTSILIFSTILPIGFGLQTVIIHRHFPHGWATGRSTKPETVNV
ncbi:hypothetical protein PAXRUDRAFT_568570 [Paxillus rubicundulus Ve08.2h10]|uniref:Uncharacterized protein n=1 Tax=Paxillus rubicundulus Ve08.2h10 TaxID=930991 RepID=A0A0D0D244_9AGAM|nr:hypothetical protein PAXRUDRAFT_568570 [Paxillus rubicundulus Ve08.2h10]